MEHAHIEAAVASAIRKLGLEQIEILPVQDLQTDLGIDSTELVELAVLVRNELGLHTERLDLKRIRTVGDLVAEAESLVAGAVS